MFGDEVLDYVAIGIQHTHAWDGGRRDTLLAPRLAQQAIRGEH